VEGLFRAYYEWVFEREGDVEGGGFGLYCGWKGKLLTVGAYSMELCVKDL
jgi:hypothetical protein